MAYFLLLLRAGRKRSQGKGRSAPEREAADGQVCQVGLGTALGPEKQRREVVRGRGLKTPSSARADLGLAGDVWTSETPVLARAPPGGREVQNRRAGRTADVS